MNIITNNKLNIIAGPCSVDNRNIEDILAIAEITVKNRFGRKQKAVAGTRVVGLKSRTALSRDGKNMGMDFHTYMENMELLLQGKSIHEFKTPPSIKIAQDIVKKTNLLVAAEIMSPLIQMPSYEGKIPRGKLLAWNPAVNQLGWPIMKMGFYAKKNGWQIGLKNGKWLGDDFLGQTTMEKTWIGLAKFTGPDEPGLEDQLVFIQRGVDIAGKGEYRSLPVHDVTKRVKQATHKKIFFDPSHTHGPKLRHIIVKGVVDAMKMKVDDETYLYDGILVEAGRSHTDTEQHITIKELDDMCQQLVEFRELVPPN